MDADSLSREQWELVDAAGLLEEIDLELGRVGEAWRVAEEAIGKAEGVSLRGAKSGHYLGNGMVYEKAGGKFYEVARNGSRGSEISTKEIRARGAEVLVPMGEAYKLQVEYERLLAQRGEVEEIGLQIGEKVKEEGKPGGEDGRVLYQLAADGDAAVAGAENDLQQLRKYKRVWDRIGVESPGFKEWFGDWEATKNAVIYESIMPKEYSSSELFPNTDFEALKNYTKETYRSLTQHTAVNMNDGVTISFPNSALGKTIFGADKNSYKWRIIGDLPELFANSVRLISDIGRPEKVSIDLVHRYGTKISIDGNIMNVAIVVREVNTNNVKKYYYDYFVDDKTTNKSTASALPYKGGDTVESTFTISRWLSEVNDHSIVVDGDGRPLLMSQVDGNGLQFKVRQAGDVGDGYYLNARNVIDDVDVNGRDIPTLKAEGYDGIRTEDGFIVFDENQVKSIGNRGTFSKTDPRVLYQEGGQMPLYPVGGYDQPQLTLGFRFAQTERIYSHG